jgi:hypothetical protein
MGQTSQISGDGTDDTRQVLANQLSFFFLSGFLSYTNHRIKFEIQEERLQLYILSYMCNAHMIEVKNII